MHRRHEAGTQRNSRLVSYYATRHSPVFRGGFHKLSRRYIEDLPIRRIDVSKSSDRRAHDDLHELAVRRVTLTERLFMARTPNDRTAREADEIDAEIDRRTYALYGLSPDDIRVINEAESSRLSPPRRRCVY